MELLLSLLTKFFIYSIFLFSLNNIIGKSGYWAIGHICFFCIGALVTGILSVIYNFSGGLIYLTFIIAPIISAIISLLLSLSTNRLKGDFFIFISISIAVLCNLANEYVAGPSGFSGIKRPTGLTNDLSILLVSIAFFILAAIYIKSFNRHPLNRIYSISRTSEKSAMSFGINVLNNNVKLFILGSVLASVSGILFAFYSTGTDPQRFSLNEAIILFALAIIGGIDSIRGSVVAAAFYVLVIYMLDSLFTGVSDIYASKIATLVFGLLLIFAIRFYPYGFFGKRKI
jgi:branched-chain amino acid transport system permease protein